MWHAVYPSDSYELFPGLEGKSSRSSPDRPALCQMPTLHSPICRQAAKRKDLPQHGWDVCSQTIQVVKKIHPARREKGHHQFETAKTTTAGSQLAHVLTLEYRAAKSPGHQMWTCDSWQKHGLTKGMSTPKYFAYNHSQVDLRNLTWRRTISKALLYLQRLEDEIIIFFINNAKDLLFSLTKEKLFRD
jgi:hypothetical protein